MLSMTNLDELMAKAVNIRVAVVGDYCLDAYWFMASSFEARSVETGRPVQAIQRQVYALGGAGNVVRNLRALGVEQVSALGVLGIG